MLTSLKQVIIAASADAIGALINAENVLYFSVQAVATGTIAGTLIVEFSNDIIVNNSVPTHWSPVPSATVSITGTAGIFAIAKMDSCYQYIRANFDASAGTGTITVNMKTNGA